jgi:hypothetical protein
MTAVELDRKREARRRRYHAKVARRANQQEATVPRLESTASADPAFSPSCVVTEAALDALYLKHGRKHPIYRAALKAWSQGGTFGGCTCTADMIARSPCPGHAS